MVAPRRIYPNSNKNVMADLRRKQSVKASDVMGATWDSRGYNIETTDQAQRAAMGTTGRKTQIYSLNQSTPI